MGEIKYPENKNTWFRLRPFSRLSSLGSYPGPKTWKPLDLFQMWWGGSLGHGLSKPLQIIPTMHAHDVIKRDAGLMPVLMFFHCVRTSSLNHLSHTPDSLCLAMHDCGAGLHGPDSCHSWQGASGGHHRIRVIHLSPSGHWGHIFGTDTGLAIHLSFLFHYCQNRQTALPASPLSCIFTGILLTHSFLVVSTCLLAGKGHLS